MKKLKHKKWFGIIVAILLCAGTMAMLNSPSKPIDAVTTVAKKEIVAAEKLSTLIIDTPEETTPEETIEDEKPKYVSLGIFKITHYCDCENCQGRWVGQTASGKTPKAFYTIAASKDIPFGTKLYFSTNYGNGLLQEFEVQDRGGAITENCIDIFVGDSSKHQLSNDLGVYYTEVFILKDDSQ